MEDRYCIYAQQSQRLKNEYLKYRSLFIAFDFDNTVFDCHKTGDTYPIVEKLLIEAKKLGFKLILFTANENELLQNAILYCKNRGYEPDYINESPVMNTHKPYYNLLLDDRAGLGESVKLLADLIEWIKEN